MTKRMLSRGKCWPIRDYEEDSITPATYRITVAETEFGPTIVGADPLVPPPRYASILEKVRERLAMKEQP